MNKDQKVLVPIPIEEWQFIDPYKSGNGGQQVSVPPRFGIDMVVQLSDNNITILCYHRVTGKFYAEWNGRSGIVDETKYRDLTSAVTHVLVSKPLKEVIQELMPSEEWIDVKDRLPESDNKNSSVYVLVVDTYWGIRILPYDQYHLCWNTDDDDDHYSEAVGGKVTHWRPLPAPPVKSKLIGE